MNKMTMLKIEENDDGSHEYQIATNVVIPVRVGWAFLPPNVPVPNFPYGKLTTETLLRERAPDNVPLELYGDRAEIDIVTAWEAGRLPGPDTEPEEPEEQPHTEAVMPAVFAAAAAFVSTATTLSDGQALAVQSLAKTWEQALVAGIRLEYNTILRKDDILYRVAQSGGVTPQAHQPPDAEGMLAVYRPIDKAHAGTLEDPIPWVYGMDCLAGTYYSYNGAIYRVADGGNMTPCVWPPDTHGLWQWEKIKEVN